MNPNDDAPTGDQLADAVAGLASNIASAHRQILILAAVVIAGFAVIGLGIVINGRNAVNAGSDADTAQKAIPAAKKDAQKAARKEAVRVAKQTRVRIRRETRTIVRRELGRRGARGFRGRPPTRREVDAAVARRFGRGAVTADQVADALIDCLNAGGCGALRGPAGATGPTGPGGANGAAGRDAAPITPEMIDAAVARHCAMNNCAGPPGAQGMQGAQGVAGPEGPPPKPATIRFVDPVTGTTYTCTIDFTIGPDSIQPCTAETQPAQ